MSLTFLIVIDYQKIIPKYKYFLQKYLKGEDTGFEVSLVDVYNEFNERVAEKYKIPKFKSKVRNDKQ